MSGAGASAERSTPVDQSPAPVLDHMDNPVADPVIDVINDTIAPFQSAPPAEQGAAGWISQKVGGVVGLVGAIPAIIDTGFGALTAPIAKLFPSLPAMTLGALHIGIPHAHMHPPSFIPPAPPIPLPSIGMTVGSGAISVLIGGLPAARAGDIGIAPTCVSFAPLFEIVTGSSNVFIGGARAARIGDVTIHCNPMAPDTFTKVVAVAGIVAGAAGGIATGNNYAIAQAAADAAILALKMTLGKDPGVCPGIGALVGPPVPNVLIGGFPCPPLGDMAFGGLLKKLKKLFNSLKNLRNSRKGNGKCSDGSHPIYLVTGENFDTFVDFDSGGLLKWQRHVTSARAKFRGPMGRGFRHFLQRSLLVRLHRAVLTDWDGEQIHFPRFEPGSEVTRADGYVLRRLERGRYRVTYRGQPAMEFAGGEFDGELPLVKLADGDGELVLSYDRSGVFSACTESKVNAPNTRRTWEFSRDAHGQITAVHEIVGANVAAANAGQSVLRASYQYNEHGALVKAVDALGGVWLYEYDGFHRITKQTDPRKYYYTFKYDAWGRCVHATGMDGLWRCNVEYFPEKNFTRYTEGKNATWEFHYDKDGFVTKIVDPYGGVKRRERDGEGRILREIDAGGRELKLLYDANGNHFARQDRFGHLYLPEVLEPRMHNPFARDLPNTPLTRMFADGVPADEQARWGASTLLLQCAPSEFADVLRRTFRFQQPGTLSTRTQARIECDALGRKVRETDARGRTREWRYDATGNLIAERDFDDRWTYQATTSWNLKGAKSDALGHSMRYRYSSIEQTTGIADPLGNESAYDYNLRGRLTGVHRNGQVREQYIYDERNHFVEKRDSRGQVLFSNTIHANHFVATRKLASGGFHRFDYDESGRITEASTDRCNVLLQFDDAGRRLKDERDKLGVRHTYGGGQRCSTVLGVFEFVEDTREHGKIKLAGPADTNTTLHLLEPGVLLRESSNGTRELLQFDEDERLEARFVWKRTSDGAWNTWWVRYTYTAHGDLVRVDDSVRGVTLYDVDAAHRLVGETTPYGERLTYELDAAGNVLSKPGMRRAEIHTGNRLEMSDGNHFVYDHRDHISRRNGSDGSTTAYTYDSFDMLVRIERVKVTSVTPAKFEYEYDGLGRRTVARTPDYERTFYWDGDRLAAEVLPSGRLRVYSYPSRSALVPMGFTEYTGLGADPESGTSYVVYSDPVGMPLHIEDASGRVVWWANRIDPYGLIDVHPAAELEYNLRWPGHYFDPETGLHYNRYRYYDPVLGRYLQSDPLGYAGSEVNLYAYPANPLVSVDVLGLMCSDASDSTPNTEGEHKKTGEEGVDDSKKIGAKANDLGASREQRVADIVGGEVSREKIKTQFGSSDIDVIGSDGSLIAVGGPGKAKDKGKLGTQLKVLKTEADSRGVKAKAAFEEGTPQWVIDYAKEKLGDENVFTFPKVE